MLLSRAGSNKDAHVLAPTPLLKNRLRASRDISYIRDEGLPYASRLVPGRAGRVWIQLYADGARHVQHYLAATPSGVSLRRIAVPGDISVLFVGDSLIFGAVLSDTSNTGLIALRQRGATSKSGETKT